MYLTIKLIHIVSATLLFGTGLGSAFYMYMAYRTGSVEVMAKINAFEKQIFITRPNPDSKEVYGKFDEIWDSHWLTHFGSKRLRFEINKVILNII